MLHAPPKEGNTHPLPDDYYIIALPGAMAAGMASRYNTTKPARGLEMCR